MNASLAILACAAALAVGAGGADGEGHDAFDDLESVDDLRRVEAALVETAARVAPTVVNLRSLGSRGGSTGSGVVITPDGLVATCGHFGRAAGRRVMATLADGTEIRGTTLGQANVGKLDCGLVRLDVGDRRLACASLGRSATLEPGDWVVTVGYTQGPPESGSRPGLVRAGRVVLNAPDEVLLDAPIDAGDSGGPAFDLRGDVVAINTRCGWQPWQNAATPVDALRDRMTEFCAGLNERDMRPDGADDGDEDVGADFGRVRRGNGRMAVQRGLPLEEVAASAQASMVDVLDSGRHAAYGTVIDDRGHVVTKRSELPDAAPGAEVLLRLPGSRTAMAEVVGSDPALDLAVLHADDLGAPALAWRRTRPLAPGQAVLVPRFDESGPALGFVSIDRRESERDWQSVPYLGVQTEFVELGVSAPPDLAGGAKVVEVMPGTAAATAGLRDGDVVASVDGAVIDGARSLRTLLAKRNVGDRVVLRVLRGGEDLSLPARLGQRPARDGGEPGRGNTVTPISRVSTGFGTVFAHDAVVQPNQCGGPVVDLDGNAIGLNIARYDRTATHALDPKTVMKAVDRIIRDAARTREAGSAPR